MVLPSINPAGGNGVNPYLTSQAGCQGMGQGRDAALGGGVAFRIGLRLESPRRGDVHDAPTWVEVGKQQQAQKIGSRDSDP